MKHVVESLFWFFSNLGGFGLLGLGVLDSSVLFMPLGQDLLMVALAAREPGRWPFYAAMAAAGSVIGTLFVDVVSRKGGEKGLEQRLPKKRLDYVKHKVSQRAGWALALAALAPPPFPYTPFIIGAAAFQYPRKKLLAIVGGARFVRYAGLGALAMFFGQRILRMADNPVIQWGILALVAVSITGSVVSLIRWARRSKHEMAQAA